MTPEQDVHPTPPSAGWTATPATPVEQEGEAIRLFQEINERRARIENAELLRRLRGL